MTAMFRPAWRSPWTTTSRSSRIFSTRFRSVATRHVKSGAWASVTATTSSMGALYSTWQF